MAMRVRQDQFADRFCGIQSELLYPTSRLVQSVTGLPIQRNKAIVGDNAFAHESGIHQDGVLKHPETYEIMTPAAIGRSTNDMVLGKHSGRHALVDRLQTLGFELSDDEIGKVFVAFKNLADRKKEIFDGDIIALIEQEIRGRNVVTWTLQFLNVSAGTEDIATATATLQHGEETFSDAATGDGPVDAVVRVLDRICGTSGTVEDYRLRAVSAGRDAQGEVSIRVNFGHGVVGGKGLSTDVIEASCRAYLDAINRAGLLALSKADGQP